MSDTSLKSDGFCYYNQSAAPFYWLFQPNQYENTFVYGEVGVNAAGGTAGSYVRQDLVDIDSFLSGRDEVLSNCNPPVPSLDEVKQAGIVPQNNNSVEILVSKYTREKKSAADIGSIEYSRWQPYLPADPQNLRFIIEDFAPQRGGMDTVNYSKAAWNSSTKRGTVKNGPKNACETLLSPARANPYSASVSGFNPSTIGRLLNGKPPGEPTYPFNGPTTQDIEAVGAASCGPNNFYGERYEKGSCNKVKQTVLTRQDEMAYNN